MKVIGGYFELELNDFGTLYHDDAIALNNGRNALKLILLQKKYTKVYLPLYSCDALEEPIVDLGIPYEFYDLTKHLLPKIYHIHNNEVILYINYFGICDNQVLKVTNMFKNVIIDNAQAFYSLPQKSIPTIYSPRKFFGVPDGGFAYCKYTQPQEFPNDESYNRSIHLLARRDNGAEFGYPFFQTNEDIHKGLPIRKMSNLTTQLLRNIDFKKVCAFRNRNFNYLHQKLGSINQFTSLISIKQINGPLAYPFIRKGNSTLKIELIKNKIFVPTYWPNMENRPIKCNTIEWDLYTNLLALPIDQRIGQLELNYIIENIKQTK